MDGGLHAGREARKKSVRLLKNGTVEVACPPGPLETAGDCATIVNQPLDKVGVHAVKQGPDLRENLDRTLRHLTTHDTLPISPGLVSFRPYPVAPLILSTGTSDGLWTAGPFWATHPWLLRLKHAIDRQWIRQYAPVQWGNTGWADLLGAEAAATSPATNQTLTGTSSHRTLQNEHSG